jgi:ribonuclease-3
MPELTDRSAEPLDYDQDEQDSRSRRSLESTLGFTFADKSLLRRALTHSSYLNENPEIGGLDNERLEFLGDAVLGFIIAEHLYHRCPEMREGELTNLRAALVKRETLALLAANLGLGDYLFLSRGEAERGGRQRPAILCAALEALIGATFLDSGPEAAKQVVLRLIEPQLERLTRGELALDAKSLLQQVSQGRWRITPSYRTMAESGPDHAKEFTVEAIIGGRVIGRGTGRTKQAAEQEAARAALEALDREEPMG